MLHDIGVLGIGLMCLKTCFVIESSPVEGVRLVRFHIWEVA